MSYDWGDPFIFPGSLSLCFFSLSLAWRQTACKKIKKLKCFFPLFSCVTTKEIIYKRNIKENLDFKIGWDPFIVIGWDPWNKKRVYLSCIEGKGGLKDIYCIAQNAALFVDLLWNIFCHNSPICQNVLLAYLSSAF